MSMDQYGAFGDIAPLLVMHDRLRIQALDADLVWVLPADVLPGVTKAYGIPVLRADVPRPLLAHDPMASREQQT